MTDDATDERPRSRLDPATRRIPATKIATLTLNRPDRLNAPTIGMRLRYAELLHQANIDDDVKVLVIRGAGDDFGTGQDLPEFMEAVRSEDGLLREVQLEDADVTYPPRRNFRHGATTTQWFTDPRGGCRTLQEFKKISIVEVKGYCYGWHFYQAGDADLVVASDDALFGHAAFRYAGAAPRMWWWATSMGIRKFQEMVFTGRPFTADEMAECGFVNSVVPRDQLEAEVQKYAMACAQNRSTDVVFMQKTFFEVMKQFQGEYMGSLLSGVLESMTGYGRPDANELGTDDAIDQGLSKAVKDFDSRFPPEWRLSKQGRAAPRMTHAAAPDYVVVDLSSGIAGAYCTKLLADGGAEIIKVEPPEGDPLRRWSASGATIPAGDDGALFTFLSSSKQSVIADPDDDDDLERVHALLQRADAVVWSKGSRLADLPALAPDAIRRAAPHLTVTSITPFGLDGPWSDRAATEFTLQAWSGGIVGLGRGSRDRAPVFVGGQIGEWLTGVVCGDRNDGVAGACAARRPGRARRRVDARDARAVPHLLPRDLRRHGGTTLPERAVHRHARRGGDERRPRRRRRRDRPAVARLLRDGRTPRVDGGPLALRQPRASAAGHRGVDGGAHDRGGPRARGHVPHPARAHRQRRDDPGDRPLPSARLDRPEPSGRLRRTRPALPVRPAPPPDTPSLRRAWANTTAHDASGAPRTRRGTRRPRPRSSCRCTACASSTSPRSGPARSARTCWRCWAPRSCTSSRRPAPTARACSPACASRSPTGGSGPGSSPV